jgi:hypothetical protein
MIVLEKFGITQESYKKKAVLANNYDDLRPVTGDDELIDIIEFQ